MKRINMKGTRILPALLTGVPLIGLSMSIYGTEKPNIVVILADDLGTNELGCYGGENLATPNIDKLAEEGIRLTNNYASTAMSVPIRASLYTGLYPARHGSYQNHKASYNNLKSVTHYLSDLGYRVGRTGKDHPVNQPGVYAFEKVDGFTVGCTASKPAPATTDGITNFIQKDAEQPFCLFVCSIHPHMPWDAGDASKFNPNDVKLPPNAVDNQKTREMFCKYLAEIQVLDDEVGKVMKVLEETGKLDNTMVIFLGEQGPQMPYGKWTLYRYGQNSAFIARYPKAIAAKTTSDALVQYEDILPTMIDLAGGEPIETLDGKSCLDVLFDKKVYHREWAYGIHNNIPEGTAYPIRSIQDKRYKLIINLTPEADYYEKHMMNMNNTNDMWYSWMMTAKNNERAEFLTSKFVKRPAVEFYDLEEDKWELNNLAHKSEYQSIIAEMRTELERWMEQQGDRGVLMDINNPEDPRLKTPLAIGTLEDIDTYMRNDLSGNYYLTNDIIIPEGTEWVPIGAASATDADPQRFRGILDGRGYSIKNLKINTASAFKGLFGRMNYAIVRNLHLEDVDIKGLAPVGGISGAIIGECLIERVSVSGKLEANREVGGIVGRVARDETHTDYQKIYDCYVNADIRATALSTDMNNSSCAGGIVGSTHSNQGNAVAKIDIRRVYVTGSVISDQKSNVAGNASGILAFYDQIKTIKMQDVIVLCDKIEAATPNLFFCRRGPTYKDFELFENVFAREGIELDYFADNDKGRGGEIDEGVIKYFSAETFKTKEFYEENTSWDFENVWYLEDGEYPKLRKPISELINTGNKTEVVLVGEWNAERFNALNLDKSSVRSIDFRETTGLTEVPEIEELNPNCLLYINGSLTSDSHNVVNIVDGEATSTRISLMDGYEFKNIIPFKADEISYERDFNYNGWASICLPFDLKTKSAGVGDIFEFTGEKGDVVIFTEAEKIEANTPYIVNVTDYLGTKSFSATNVDVPVTTIKQITRGEEKFIFKGTFEKIYDGVGGYFYIALDGREFFRPVLPEREELFIPTFSSYIEAYKSFEQLQIGLEGPSGIRIIPEDGLMIWSQNGSIYILSDKQQDICIYSVDGRCIKLSQLTEGENRIEGLGKGVYFLNNLKVVIR